MMRLLRAAAASAAFLLLAVLPASVDTGEAWAARVSDIRNTKHNLSSRSTNAVKATGEDEVCVFCHTPHAASQGMTPLWNRAQSNGQYDTYHSSSLDASPGDIGLSEPNGTSKLCLSCHDGTIALGQVNVLNGAVASGPLAVQNSGAGGTMPSGRGTDSGFTRNLGTNLENDHPISFTYDDALAIRDGELRRPTSSGGNPRMIDSRSAGYRPRFPLENGKLQCTTCHDPHIRDDNSLEGNIKFLRENRLQKAAPSSTYVPANDILCLGCHTKDGWSGSAHASPTVANETYTTTAAGIRDFPAGTAVWQASCLNCHDTHTVQGARRLLREGTDGPVNGQNVKAGGSSAIEQTCYQCHSNGTGPGGKVLNVQGTANAEVPDIKKDFDRAYKMPISDQPEVHDIGTGAVANAGKDFIESREKLGLNNPLNRHTECTDCHNPHRVLRNKLFTGTGSTASGTHDHTTTPHSNIASGALRGTWGVEPVYSSSSFGSEPTSFTIKRGDPGASIDTSVNAPYVTREYQICLKCHSNYAYTTPPDLGYWGGTAPGTNGMNKYTNQAMEFQAPAASQGQPGGNHRSWHPVMKPTGRTNNASAWRAPWAAGRGSQTMYCSDCHGAGTAVDTVVPNGNTSTEHGDAWGPHGSDNPFILKGAWSNTTGSGSNGDLCFRCHDPANYTATGDAGGGTSGFNGGGKGNLHTYHANKIGKIRCNWCHVAVPHGWKNKAFLVNLNDVGPEVGLPNGTQVRNGRTAAYTNGPYYNNAVLKVRTFGTSGSWPEGNCGSNGAPGNGASGRTWMRDSTENCVGAP